MFFFIILAPGENGSESFGKSVAGLINAKLVDMASTIMSQ